MCPGTRFSFCFLLQLGKATVEIFYPAFRGVNILLFNLCVRVTGDVSL
jgi:hypothetical protein